ncbi:hypothetical protein MMC06_000076 [Schaereria dolodes]|nr:hypothetical protein [Schaereria dolodes]
MSRERTSAGVASRADNLRKARDGEIIHYVAMVGLLAAAVMFGLVIAGAFSTREEIFADAMYNLVSAVGNTSHAPFRFPVRYANITNKPPMEALVLDILPFVKQSYPARHQANHVISIVASVLFAISFAAIMAVEQYARIDNRTPYFWRHLRHIIGISCGLLMSIIAIVVLLNARYIKIPLEMSGNIFNALAFAGAFCIGTGALMGQAWPETKGAINDFARRKSYQSLMVCFLGLAWSLLAFTCLILLLLDGTDTVTDRTALALYKLRDLIVLDVDFRLNPFSYTNILDPDSFKTLEDNVLPYVGHEGFYTKESWYTKQTRIVVLVAAVSSVFAAGVTGLGLLAGGSALTQSRHGPYRKQLPRTLIGICTGIAIAMATVAVLYKGHTPFMKHILVFHSRYMVLGFFATGIFAFCGLLVAAYPEERGNCVERHVDDEEARANTTTATTTVVTVNTTASTNAGSSAWTTLLSSAKESSLKKVPSIRTTPTDLPMSTIAEASEPPTPVSTFFPPLTSSESLSEPSKDLKVVESELDDFCIGEDEECGREGSEYSSVAPPYEDLDIALATEEEQRDGQKEGESDSLRELAGDWFEPWRNDRRNVQW